MRPIGEVQGPGPEENLVHAPGCQEAQGKNRDRRLISPIPEEITAVLSRIAERFSSTIP
jgi:hypothetical protein